MDDKALAYATLGVALGAAPNGEVQQALSSAYNKAEMDLRREDNPDRALLKYIAGVLYDGVAYGNWPEKAKT